MLYHIVCRFASGALWAWLVMLAYSYRGEKCALALIGFFAGVISYQLHEIVRRGEE
jgi:uncharacterized membrane protein